MSSLLQSAEFLFVEYVIRTFRPVVSVRHKIFVKSTCFIMNNDKIYLGQKCHQVCGDESLLSATPSITMFIFEAPIYNKLPPLIPLYHTGHESPESPRIDFFLIRGDS